MILRLATDSEVGAGKNVWLGSVRRPFAWDWQNLPARKYAVIPKHARV